MNAFREKDNEGRPIWRVKYFLAKRRVRKTFHSLEDANAWIDSNREIATEEGRIFWEAWYGINNKERHDLSDALSLMRAHWAKHPQSKLTMVEAARNQIALVDSIETSLPLQEAIDRFLQSKVNRKRKGSVSSDWVNVLGTCLNRMCKELPNKTLVEFTTEEFEEYLDDQDWAPRTFNNYHDYLNAIYKWAIEKKYAQENPLKGIEKFAKKMIIKEVIVPPVPTIEAILKLARKKEYRYLQPALDLGFGLAMRSSEISRISWEDITESVVHVSIHVGKGGQSRNISPRPPLYGIFKSLLAEKGAGPVMPKGWRSDLTKLFQEAGLGKPRNVMRKSGGSYHFHATGSEALTREMMGHTEDSNIFTSSYKALRFGDDTAKTPISQDDGKAYYRSWK